VNTVNEVKIEKGTQKHIWPDGKARPRPDRERERERERENQGLIFSRKFQQWLLILKE